MITCLSFLCFGCLIFSANSNFRFFSLALLEPNEVCCPFGGPSFRERDCLVTSENNYASFCGTVSGNTSSIVVLGSRATSALSLAPLNFLFEATKLAYVLSLEHTYSADRGRGMLCAESIDGTASVIATQEVVAAIREAMARSVTESWEEIQGAVRGRGSSSDFASLPTFPVIFSTHL